MTNIQFLLFNCKELTYAVAFVPWDVKKQNFTKFISDVCISQDTSMCFSLDLKNILTNAVYV